MNWRGQLLLYGLAVCGVVLVFGPHLGNDFILDDQAQVVENPHLGPEGSWVGVFHTDLWSHMRGRIGAFHSYYRPTLYLVYRGITVIAGRNPAAFHLASLLLHVLCAWGLYLLLASLAAPRNVNLAAPLLFLFHPITGETVFSIADMCDQLALLGLLASLLSARRLVSAEGARAVAWGASLFLSTAFALLSKESAVVVPVLVTLLVVWQRAHVPASIWRCAGPSWLALASYASFRLAFLRGSHLGELVAAPWEALAKAGLALAWYVRHLLLPYPLSPFHPFPDRLSLPGQYILGLATLLALGALLLFALRRRRFLFWLSWSIFPLVPALFHFFFSRQIASGIVVAERYAYVSAAAVCVLVLLLLDRVPGERASRRTRRHVFWAGTGALAVSGAVLLSGYGQVYASEKEVFEHGFRVNPENPFVLNGIGQTLLKEHRPAEALPYLTRAVEIRPNGAGWRVNRGIALYRLGRVAEARLELEAAVALDPEIATAHALLGDVHRDLGDLEGARAAYERSATLDPGNAAVLQNLGAARLLLGDLEGAVSAWSRSLECDPEACDTRFNLGTALWRLGRVDEARPHLEAFVECAGEDRRPQLAEVRRLLGAPGS